MDDMNREGDAQRTFEQKALRNVRGLVDKIEAADSAERKLQKRILIVFVALLAFFAILWVTGIFPSKPGTQSEVVVPAIKPAAK